MVGLIVGQGVCDAGVDEPRLLLALQYLNRYAKQRLSGADKVTSVFGSS